MLLIRKLCCGGRGSPDKENGAEQFSRRWIPLGWSLSMGIIMLWFAWRILFMRQTSAYCDHEISMVVLRQILQQILVTSLLNFEKLYPWYDVYISSHIIPYIFSHYMYMRLYDYHYTVMYEKCSECTLVYNFNNDVMNVLYLCVPSCSFRWLWIKQQYKLSSHTEICPQSTVVSSTV